MNKNSKIYIAGHRGLVGSAILRKLQADDYSNLITRDRQELDLLNAKTTADFFKTERPEYVIDAAAKVGGIHANNTYPAEFIYNNLCIQNNIIHGSYLAGVSRLLFMGSACIYPKICPQPIKEEYLLTGALEPTNEPYAIAKIAGYEMCDAYNRQYGTDYFSVMPTNLYGPNDHFNLENSHVIPALMRKFYEAKTKGKNEVVLWGTGSPTRDFMHSDDLADACIFLMNQKTLSHSLINIGTGKDISIKDLAETVSMVSGFQGKLTWDTSKPDGTPRRRVDTKRLNAMGWHHTIMLEDGLRSTYEWFLGNVALNAETWR
jgi:GDP-L-fucose synthase